MISAKRITTLKAKHKAYILRTCAKDMSAHGGFVWPKKGLVSCPDWNPAPQCGGGLHGLLWGIGDGQLLDWDDGAKWLVVGIDEWVDLEGKVKTPSGEVVFCGKAADAVALLVVLGADPTKCVRGQATASGDSGQATASGYRGQATASGYLGRAAAGPFGTLVFRWFDGERFRIVAAYVGEAGIEAGRYYRLNDAGEIIPTGEYIQKESK